MYTYERTFSGNSSDEFESFCESLIELFCDEEAGLGDPSERSSSLVSDCRTEFARSLDLTRDRQDSSRLCANQHAAGPRPLIFHFSFTALCLVPNLSHSHQIAVCYYTPFFILI